jgi:hypothetical protein
MGGEYQKGPFADYRLNTPMGYAFEVGDVEVLHYLREKAIGADLDESDSTVEKIEHMLHELGSVFIPRLDIIARNAPHPQSPVENRTSAEPLLSAVVNETAASLFTPSNYPSKPRCVTLSNSREKVKEPRLLLMDDEFGDVDRRRRTMMLDDSSIETEESMRRYPNTLSGDSHLNLDREKEEEEVDDDSSGKAADVDISALLGQRRMKKMRKRHSQSSSSSSSSLFFSYEESSIEGMTKERKSSKGKRW